MHILAIYKFRIVIQFLQSKKKKTPCLSSVWRVENCRIFPLVFFSYSIPNHFFLINIFTFTCFVSNAIFFLIYSIILRKEHWIKYAVIVEIFFFSFFLNFFFVFFSPKNRSFHFHERGFLSESFRKGKDFEKLAKFYCFLLRKHHFSSVPFFLASAAHRIGVRSIYECY